ncbi:porin [Salmonella enterica subsp. enterica serovar Kentucky]|nr:porin [Salmonella enterica subsp. enterica serovar Kentucky]
MQPRYITKTAINWICTVKFTLSIISLMITEVMVTKLTRLGFKGETQINDQLVGFGQWEYEFKGNRTESEGSDKDKTRLAFAGLKFAEYGSFDYGRNYGVAYDIGAWTDVLPEFGGDTDPD